METTLYNISQVLGISIVQSLWQGMLVYLILRIVFAAAPSLSSVKKYYAAIFAMLAISALFIYSLVNEAGSHNWAVLKPGHLDAALPGLSLSGRVVLTPEYYSRFAAYMPYICAIYTVGLLGNLLKLGWEWNKIVLIKKSVICAEQMQQFINKFSKKLDISRPILLKFSSRIDVPCMTGYFKPLILLPVSLSTHLSACEVESILLHELAHIKRNDYLANLLQQVVSVMLFFNPFNRLINRTINQERENSCDDLVVEKTGKPLIYAQALLKLEAARVRDFQLALAVTGKKFYLLKRIERIMKTQNQPGNMRHLFIAALLLAGGLCSIAWLNPVYGKIIRDKTPAKIAVNLSGPVASGDSTEYLKVSDTIKHKNKIAKIKTVYRKHTVVKKGDTITEFRGGKDDSLAGFYNTREWRTQMEAIRKHGEEMRKKFDSPEWRAQMEAMRKQGEEMRKKFDSPEWKEQMANIQKQGEEMRKKFDSPEWKEQMENIRKQGEEMRKKFDSPEWKEQMANIQKQGEEMRKKFESPEWKAQMENMKKQGEEMRKKFESPEWKAQMKDIQKQGEEMRKKFDSPEWKAQMEQLKKQGEEMRKKFDSPEWKAQMEQLKKQGEELRKQFDGKAWKGQKWILKDSTGGIDIYKPAKKDTLDKQ